MGNIRTKKQRIFLWYVQHIPALFGHCTICEHILAFPYLDLKCAVCTEDDKIPVPARFAQTLTLPSNTFLVLIQQSKCKNLFEKLRLSIETRSLTSKIELLMGKYTLRKDSCIEMPHSGKDLPRWGSEEGGLDLIQPLGCTPSTKVRAEGAPGRCAKVVDEWLRAKTFRKQLHAV